MEPQDYAAFPTFWDDATFRKWNLWGYIDADDVSQACMRGLEADVAGANSYIIAADDTVMNRPSRDLMTEVFPNVPIRELEHEYATLLSITKARKELGFKPAVTWRDKL